MISTEISQVIGRNIKLYRNLRQLSQEDLAHYANIGTSHLGHIERGTKNPTLETLVKISKGLHIELKQLFESELNEVNLNPVQLVSYQSVFDRIESNKQQELISILEALLKLADH